MCRCYEGFIPDPQDSSKCVGRNDAYSLWYSFEKFLKKPSKQKKLQKYHYFVIVYRKNDGIVFSHTRTLRLINERSSQLCAQLFS